MNTSLHSHVLAQALNHLMEQNPTLQVAFSRHVGRSFLLSFPPFSAQLSILSGGMFGASEGETDAQLLLKSSLLFRSWLNESPRASDVEISGDTRFALTVAHLLGELRWSWAQECSRILGDRLTAKLEMIWQIFSELSMNAMRRGALGAAEFVRDECALSVSAEALSRWSESVSNLRDDAARFEARLTQLSERLNTKP